MSRIAAPGSMAVEVRFFAVLRDRAGEDGCRVELPTGSTVASLRERVEDLFPDLPDSYAVAVGLDYATGGRVLEDGDQVALIPPVSGG